MRRQSAYSVKEQEGIIMMDQNISDSPGSMPPEIAGNQSADDGKTIRLTHGPLCIPTYEPYPPDKNPVFHEKRSYQGASGRVYPLPVTDRLSHEKKDRFWDCYTLENEYLKVQVLPEIGGRIHMGLDKTNGYHFIYHNQVIKPALIGLAGSWCAGGIEFNWPQHHRPTTFMSAESTTEEGADGSRTVWTGETEPMYHTKAMAGVTLHPGRSWLKVKVRAYNPTPWPQPFMWWANLGVHVNDGYRINFPPDVHQVAYHDRSSVTAWPVLKGKYADLDFGDGVDGSWYKNLKAAGSFMVMDGDSQYGFVQGYDTGKRAGTVHVADRHVSPGKKLFTWGTNDSAKAWCRNLTDEDGPYIELMTGMYTDNQPDFSWLQPDETRAFEHCWYPILEIGLVKNATEDAAVSLERETGGIRIGLHATGRFNGCRVVLSEWANTCRGHGQAGKSGSNEGVRVLFDALLDIAPDKPYLEMIPVPEAGDDGCLSISLFDKDGRLLVSFDERDAAETDLGSYPAIPARTPTPEPHEAASVEELYLYGLHLEQYRHHSLDPEHWYLEALRRDPDDSRCNKAMGLLMLKQGRFAEAQSYLLTALNRLTMRNTHPHDGEVSYLLGITLRYLGRDADAYGRFAKADWNQAWQAVSRLEMAELDCKAGRYGKALAQVDRALSVSEQSLRGWNLKTAILRHMGRLDEAGLTASGAVMKDPLNHRAWWELGLIRHERASGEPPTPDPRLVSGEHAQAELVMEQTARVLTDKPDAMLDIALGYMAAGMDLDALGVFERMTGPVHPLSLYHKAALLSRLGRMEEARTCFETAEKAVPSLCFPNRLEDMEVLSSALVLHPEAARAAWNLGCLYYDRRRHEEAISCWEKAVALDSEFAAAQRCLALALFDKRHDPAGSKMAMEAALHADPHDARLLYELLQLYRNSDDVTVADRLRLIEANTGLASERNDLYVEWMILLLQAGRLDEAAERITAREYDVYEGGEGRLVRVFEWIHILRGLQMLGKGEAGKALDETLRAESLPACFHEGRNAHASMAHIHWFAGKAAAACGDAALEAGLYAKACESPHFVTDMTLYKGLAMRALGRCSEAQALFDEMISAGCMLVKKGGRYDHFATGVPTPAPFEGDRGRRNHSEGLYLQSLGHWGLGEREQATAMLREVLAISANHTGAWIHAGKSSTALLLGI